MSGPAVSIGQASEAGRKARNDDSYGVLVPEPPLLATKGIAMAIADGMSSSDAAKEASETAVKSFLEDYICTHESWSVKKCAATVLGAVNQWLYRQGRIQYLSDRGLVTTFSGAVLKGGMVHVFHAGDSRIALWRDGVLEPLTTDHRVHLSREKSQLSRALGILPDLDIDTTSRAVAPGDVLVFTTDGVHEAVPPGAIARILTETGEDLDAAAHAIVRAAFEAGSEDNLTCQLVRIEAPGTIEEAAWLDHLGRLPFPPPLGPGMTLEGYEILRELHASPRSQVYLAREPGSGGLVALKTPSPNFADDPAYIEMFTREEWAGRRVASPNVVRVLEPPARRGFLYTVTEYVEGETLRDWMKAHPEPPLVEVRNIVDQIAAGLRAFHRRDMIHQDLKPENIMIDRFGTVKIVDFGSTRVAGLEEAGRPVAPPSLPGTRAYMAPEYLKGYRPTRRSDIFSLGVIVYELYTGALPYGAGFARERDVARARYVPATRHRPSLPGWIDAALAKAVALDADARYEVLSAFVADLARPNPALERQEPPPLIERRPLLFWQVATAALAALSLILLALVLG